MVKIDRISEQTFNEDGQIEACGCVTLSNAISVWFSDIHPIKTLDQAIETANTIVTSLNQKP